MAHVHHDSGTFMDPGPARSVEPESVLRPQARSRRPREQNRPLTVALAIGAALLAAVVIALALGDGERRMDAPTIDDPAAPVRPGQPAR